MSRVDSPALRGSWLGSLLRFLNPIVRRILASPFHWPLSHWFVLLSWNGLKTGEMHSTPISYIEDDTGMWATTGDRWPRFVADNPSFRIRQHGRWRSARAVVITDRDESRLKHDRIFEEHGWFRFLAGIPRTDGGVDDAAVVRSIAAGRQLVRIESRQVEAE